MPPPREQILSDSDLASAAAKLVRLALFTEYRREPLKRDTVAQMIIPKQKRAFQEVLTRANQDMRSVFGLELVELRARRKGDMDDMAMQTQAQTQTQRKKKKKRRRNDDSESEAEGSDGSEGEEDAPAAAKVPMSKTYIVRSCLPTGLIEQMTRPNPLPMPEGGEDAATLADSGAVLQWEKGDASATGALGLLGIRTVILCIILSLGRSVPDDQLHSLLRRLGLHRDTILPYTLADGTGEKLTLDKYLDLLARKRYLEKVESGGTGGNPKTTEWRWGAREAEFSEKAAGAFIEKIFFDREESDSEDEEATRAREANRKRVRTELERAAGGPLADS